QRLGPRRRGCGTGWIEDLAVDGEAPGRSRGGLTSKLHLAVDRRGLPMSIILTPGQAGGNPQLLPLLDQVAVRRDGPGRPRTRPDRVLADTPLPHQHSGRTASTWDRLHQSRAARPDRPPRREGFPWWATTGLRSRSLRRPQRRRTLLQPAQAGPGSGHPLRQTRRLLPIGDAPWRRSV